MKLKIISFCSTLDRLLHGIPLFAKVKSFSFRPKTMDYTGV